MSRKKLFLKGKNKFLFSLLPIFLFLFFINFVSSAQINTEHQIIVSCSGFSCDSINISIYDPDSSLIVDNSPMTSNTYYANYSLIPNLNGNYSFFYSDGGNISNGSFEVTPSGYSNLIGYLFLFLAIIFLSYLLGVKTENNWIMMIASIEVLFFGFWILNYGIDIIKDYNTTRALGFLIWGLAIISLYKSAEGQLAEGWTK